MEIRRYASDLLASNMYVIAESDSAIVIDPCRDVTPAAGLRIEQIILTHEHYDHISGVRLWKEQTGAKVLCSKTCAENIRSPRKNLARFFQAFCELQTWVKVDRIPAYDPEFSCEADQVFENEMSFGWKGHQFRLTELPGHSRGSIGIFLDEVYFFSGDSMLEGKETELRFPGGSKSLWKTVSLPKLADLPEEIKVFPGHFGDFVYRKNM